jgi:hypothetical protein
MTDHDHTGIVHAIFTQALETTVRGRVGVPE